MAKLGLNQSQLAEKVGVHKNYVNLVLNGKRNVSRNLVEKINQLLGVENKTTTIVNGDPTDYITRDEFKKLETDVELLKQMMLNKN